MSNRDGHSKAAIGVPATGSDKGMVTQSVEYRRPLPCVVIVIHGVNDIGEAFPNVDEGICRGLNKRLGRTDLKPNRWEKVYQDTQGRFCPYMKMDLETTAEMKIVEEGYSPVIPFYWGYRPVDKETYYQEQQAYKERLDRKEEDPELPYDSYWVERGTKINSDNFKNWVDDGYSRNGGPFANATSCLPDMYGPGFQGILGQLGKIVTPNGAKSYDNPSRIYTVFAAHRLMGLIKEVREKHPNETINIVAHSQGTLITMLANLLLEKAGIRPVDCVLLNNSPYTLEVTRLEIGTKQDLMGVQTNEARQQTLLNFVRYVSRQKQTDKFTTEILIKKGVINTNPHPDLGLDKEFYLDPRFSRNNFGKVYNYFSPNDGVVSLRNVQGMGWEGIYDDLLEKAGGSLRQRVFFDGHPVGDDSQKAFLGQIVTEIIARPGFIPLRDPNKYQYYGASGEEVIKLNALYPQYKGGIYQAVYHREDDNRLIISRSLTIEEGQKSRAELEKTNVSQVYRSFDDAFLTAAGGGNSNFLGVRRVINGEEVPEPITYSLGGGIEPNSLSQAVHNADLINNETVTVLIPTPAFVPARRLVSFNDSFDLSVEADDSITLISDIDGALVERMNSTRTLEDGLISEAHYTEDIRSIRLKRGMSQKERLKKIPDKSRTEKDMQTYDNSYHSGMFLHKEVPAKIMAFDLAVGHCDSFQASDKAFWQQLVYRADWRSPMNPDEDTVKYYRTGELPDPIKKAMQYPKNDLEGTNVINDFYEAFVPTGMHLFDSTRRLIAELTRGDVQWPLPKPDLPSGGQS